MISNFINDISSGYHAFIKRQAKGTFLGQWQKISLKRLIF